MLGEMTIAGERGYRYLEHTADTGIEAWGATLADAFAEAALGLFALMVDPSTVKERTERRFVVRGDDVEDLLVRWLSELIAVVDSEGLLLRRFAIDSFEGKTMVARGWGETLDPSRHEVRVAVKAATYHRLSVDAGPPARVRVILDL